MKQVNYLDEDYKKNLRNKVWELLKNGDIEEADKIFSTKLDIHEIMGTWNWLHKILIEPENTNPISIEYLIKKGVNPILKDEYNMAPLNWAMANGKNIEAAKILLKAGGDPNLADKGVREIPLYKVCYMKPFNKELLELFLAYGGDIYKEYKRYGTAILGKNLYEHIQNNKLDLFKDAGEYLFEYNKDIEKYGKDYFINKHKSLLKDEADSLLHEAVIDFDIVKIKKLLDEGYDKNIKNSLNYTPLVKVFSICRLENLQAMVEISDLLYDGTTDSIKAFIIRLDEWLDEYSKFKDNSELIEKREALNYLIKKFEVELPKKIERHNGKSKIKIKSIGWQNQHSELWEQLVPEIGVAETLQGEVIRLSGKIAYEIIDNGGLNWGKKYKELLRNLIKYLKMATPLSKDYLERAEEIEDDLDENINAVTDDEIELLMEYAVKWVQQNLTPISLGKVDYNL